MVWAIIASVDPGLGCEGLATRNHKKSLRWVSPVTILGQV